jgi:hypothetical protein
MPEPNALALSHLASSLVNKKVTFAPAKPVNVTAPQIYGSYTVHPDLGVLVVRADLRLLASLGGALNGLPDSSLAEHVKGNAFSDALADAAYEVLNIASKVVTPTGRAVLKAVVTDVRNLDDASLLVLKKAAQHICFNVSVQDYQGGMFSIFAAPAA